MTTKKVSALLKGNGNSRLLELAISASCLLILTACVCSVRGQAANTSGFSHVHNTLLPAIPGVIIPLSSPPPPMYDEQLGTTFTQNFPSIAYNVTAAPQADPYGYGPAYLVNGLSNDGYWYQIGLTYDWPYVTGGYNQGFSVIYEVFDSSKNSNGPGVLSFTSPVNSGDLVLLSLYSSNGIVYMSAKDWNSGAVETATYADSQTSYFAGNVSSPSSNGFFTGLMTEWYHVNPYYGDESAVTYSNNSFGLSSAWMWMDEWEPGFSWSGAWSAVTPGPVSYSSNPTQLQSFSSHGANEYGSAYEFITGSITPEMTSITLLPASGSSPLSPTNVFAVSFTLGGQQQIDYVQNGTSTLSTDSGTIVTISGNSSGSTTSEEWVLNSNANPVSLASGSTMTYYYYDVLVQSTKYAVTGGGNLTNPNLTYYGAPTVESSQSLQNPTIVPLSQSTPQTIWTTRGSAAAVDDPISGSPAEQWSTQTASWNISAPFQIPNLIIYYHQFNITIGYKVVGGGSGYTMPTISCVIYGSQTNLTANTFAWLDAGTNSTFPQTLTGSTLNERWIAMLPVIQVNASGSVSATYYHQFQVGLQYTVANLSTGSGNSDPNVTFTQFGASASDIAKTNSTPLDWVDAGSTVTYSNPIGGAVGEQWIISPENSANPYSAAQAVSASEILNPVYYHQFQVTANYSTSDSSMPSASVLLSGTQCGTANYQLTLTSSPQTAWLDANSVWSINTPIAPSGTERWSASGGSSGTLTAPASINPSLIHQYYLLVDSPYGSPFGTGWYDSGATANFGVTSPFTSTAGTRYLLIQWIGTGNGSYTGADASGSITLNQAITQTASWETQYQLSFAATPLNGGSTNPTGTDVWTNAGSLQISATQNSGYLFSGWSSSTSFVTFLDSNSLLTTVTINGPGTITANFTPISATPTPPPTVSPSPPNSPNSSPSPVLSPTASTSPSASPSSSPTSPSSTLPKALVLAAIAIVVAAAAIVIIIRGKQGKLRKSTFNANL